jgi:glycerol-3-phosphate acyltransferase PlsX
MSDEAMKKVVIALDGMGGDHAPKSVMLGADIAHKKYPEVRFLIFGDEAVLKPYLDEYPSLKSVVEIIHTSNKVASEDKPATALRNSKDSSMRLAIEAVKDGNAHAIVSSGNTGALMAIAKIVLRTLPEIDRPAITCLMPNRQGQSVMLDVGANAECTAENLFQFAIMGNAFAKVVLKLVSPKIGLLNIGSEEVKGNDTVKAAAVKIRESKVPLNFYGSIEGNDIAEGIVDVIVTDGFSGNISIKTAEGTVSIYKSFLKQAFGSNIIAKIGYLLARNSFKKLFGRLDPRLYNGAMFVGLNGIVVKSHGSSDEIGFANAVSVAIELASHNINEKIADEINSYQEEVAAA